MPIKPAARTTGELIAELVSRDPDHEFLVDGNQRITYAEFHQRVAIVGGALLAHGVAYRDRVGILAGNRYEWMVVYFAASSIGAIAVGLNTWATARELAYQIEHAKIKLLFVEHQFRDRDFVQLVSEARSQKDGLPVLATVVDFDNSNHVTRFDEWCRNHESVTAESLAGATHQVKADDVACLLYTSGSTALPKGVPLQHSGLIDNMWEIGERQHLRADDRLWLSVSLFWSLASVNAVFALMTHGATIVLQHHFDADEALRLIESEGCSVFYGTPNMALALAEVADKGSYNLSSLRTGVTIGTPAQIQRVADIGVPGICNVYGLTEAYGNSTVTDANAPLAIRLESVGKALDGVEVKILQPGAEDVAASGELGEIVLRGNVTPGYWEDAALNATTFTDDGWFRTGDLGMLDDEGYLYYRGRIKEIVKTGGINVAPAEIEGVLALHPAVELAFVTGVADERLDEALAAVIVLREGRAANISDLTAHCRDSLAAYKTPRQFLFVDPSALPLTSTGKLKRSELPKMFG